jgi:hypothetical protein
MEEMEEEEEIEEEVEVVMQLLQTLHTNVSISLLKPTSISMPMNRRE